jgi:hypothetical protein
VHNDFEPASAGASWRATRCGSTTQAPSRSAARPFPMPTPQRPTEVFSELFAHMVKQPHRGLRRKIADTTYLIDSTTVRLNGLSQWARFSAGVCGAKVHVIYDPDADRPIYALEQLLHSI